MINFTFFTEVYKIHSKLFCPIYVLRLLEYGRELCCQIYSHVEDPVSFLNQTSSEVILYNVFVGELLRKYIETTFPSNFLASKSRYRAFSFDCSDYTILSEKWDTIVLYLIPSSFRKFINFSFIYSISLSVYMARILFPVWFSMNLLKFRNTSDI